MTRYRCTNCDNTFEHSSGKPRCPRCLRTHGLEEIIASTPGTRRPVRRRHLLIALAILFGLGLAVAGGILFVRHRTDLPQPGALAVLDPGLLKQTLIHRGVSERHAVNPFEAGPELRKLVARAKGAKRAKGAEGAKGAKRAKPEETVKALARIVSKLLDKVRPDLDGSPDGPVRTASQLLSALEKGSPDRPIHVLSYELAALMVAVLREAGLSALICQTHRIDAPMPTAEVAGGIGRYLAVVYRPEQLGQDPLVVLDPIRALALPPWAGSGNDLEMGASAIKPGALDLVALDDASAAAHLLALRALRLRISTPDKAYRLSAMADQAASPSATLQLIRAKVLAGAGGTKDAVSTARKARSIHDGPSQRTTLAQLLLSTGAVAEAISHLEQAVRKDPAYWPAQLTLAVVLMLDNPERGTKHLEAGLKVAPQEPALLLLKASVHLGQGETGEAIEILRPLARRLPDEKTLLLLYQALIRSDEESHKQEAQETKERLLDVARDKERMSQLLLAIDQAKGDSSSEQAPPRATDIPRISLPDVSLGK